MIKKLNNKLLLTVLIALVAIYAITKYIRDKQGENTFKTHIIPKIDTNKVNLIYIYPRFTNVRLPISLQLKGKTWYASQNGITSRADQHSGSYIIKLVEGITPDHLATNDPNQWKDYDVTDTSGTRVVVMDNKDTLFDLLIGRFSYNPQMKRAMSCVRIHGQNDAYYVEGFLTMNIANDFKSWRDRGLITGDPAHWSKLLFTYPADSGFTVTRNGMGWMVNDEKPDSLGADQVLTKLSQQNYGEFVDKFDTNANPVLYTLKITDTQNKDVVLKAYAADTANRYVVTSSINPGAYVSGVKEGIFNSIFVSKQAFFHHTEKPKGAPSAGAMPHKMRK